MHKITMELTNKQLQVLYRALDFYVHIGILQLEEINWLITTDKLPMKKTADRKRIEVMIDQLKYEIAGLRPNTSYSIANKKVHNDFKVIYDLLQTILFQGPGDMILKTSDQPLPKINFEEVKS